MLHGRPPLSVLILTLATILSLTFFWPVQQECHLEFGQLSILERTQGVGQSEDPLALCDSGLVLGAGREWRGQVCKHHYANNRHLLGNYGVLSFELSAGPAVISPNLQERQATPVLFYRRGKRDTDRVSQFPGGPQGVNTGIGNESSVRLSPGCWSLDLYLTARAPDRGCPGARPPSTRNG